MKRTRPLRVGFDLDGVILYNPARIIRPFVATFKRLVLKKQRIKFYVPQGKVEQQLFRLFHKSSIFVAPGLSDVRRLVEAGEIEAYLITARFDYLKKDTQAWLDRIHADKIFKAWYWNAQNEQPHLFKTRKCQALKLDVFIEDNWDIVHYAQNLTAKKPFKTKLYWIYNLFDRQLDYPYKFPYLQKAVTFLIQEYRLKPTPRS